jgi:predicted AlkP superfamily phosphohydrolase/phosphomutase
LNRWLIERGILTPQVNEDKGNIQNIDWSRSQAYALGLNSLYLNQAGREGQGIVQPGEIESVLTQLRDELLSWQGPDGRPVVRTVASRKEALTGPLAEYGPDLIVGYSPGYRASAQTGLGSWEQISIENNRDHWGADHCIDVNSVPGVLFSNQDLGNLSTPSYRDFPMLAIGEELDAGGNVPPPPSSQEDQEVLEERLKSLGYL